jgi:hypothetical protein
LVKLPFRENIYKRKLYNQLHFGHLELFWQPKTR